MQFNWKSDSNHLIVPIRREYQLVNNGMWHLVGTAQVSCSLVDHCKTVA